MPLIQEGGATEAPDAGPFVEELFSRSRWIATGGSDAIVNGLAMSSGSMLLTKRYNAVDNWRMTHSSSTGLFGNTNNLNAWSSAANLTSFNSNGFTTAGAFASGARYTAYAWLQAAEFMDYRNWTGSGVTRTISHDLGVSPGMMILKNDSSYNWVIWHKDFQFPGVGWFQFSSNPVQNSGNLWGVAFGTPAANSSVINIGTSAETNLSGTNVRAFLFADQGITGAQYISSVTTDSSGNATVTTGWEPQFIMYKSDASSNDWQIYDMHMNVSVTNSYLLVPNTSAARTSASAKVIPYTDGWIFAGLPANTKVYFLAIRSSTSRKPTVGTNVFGIGQRAGTGAAADYTGWAPNNFDTLIIRPRQAYANIVSVPELGHQSTLQTESTSGFSTTSTKITDILSTGISVGTSTDVNPSGINVIHYAIKRAKGFHDVVRFTGNGVARTHPHDLRAIPDLMLFKNMDTSPTNWAVYLRGYHAGYSVLNNNEGYSADSTAWNNTAATATNFSVGTLNITNENNKRIVALLFANRTGVCKISTYVGNGSTQNIPCGFTGNARFVMIVDWLTGGNWMFLDTTRGINGSSAADPFMWFNASAVETTGTSILEPFTGGFTVSNALTNTNGATYMYMAIA